MTHKTCLYLAGFILILGACNTEVSNNQSDMMNKKGVNAPIAERQTTELVTHGDIRKDEYYWMKLSDEQKNATQPDSQTSKVLAYLHAENNYTKKLTSHLDSFQDALFDEIVGRIKQTDMSVPYLKNGYYYLTRYEEGKEYPIYTRKKDSLDNEENMLLDVNELAKPYEYYSARGLAVSPDNKILAFGEDTLSRRIYKIRFKDLATGEYLEDEIENTTGAVVWASDNKTLFYTRKDDALRAYKIFKHKLGSPSSEDTEVYHESDETFSCYVYKEKTNNYIIIGSYATVSNEFRYIPAAEPDAEFQVFQERERDLEYGIDYYDGHWYVVTNKDGATNFKIMRCPQSATTKEHWRDFIPYDNNVLVSSLDVFDQYLAVNERKDGLSKIKIVPWNDLDKASYIDFDEEAYVAYTSTNPEYQSEKVRLYYSSLTTPGSTYDYNMSTGKLELKKRQEVIGDFDPDEYVSERIMVDARDGTKVPVSLVRRKDTELNGASPLLLYGYGSYGASMDPYFSSVRLSLLDREFIFAIAHIRGGQELGRQWYDDGKLLNKKNTFYDFIDAGKYLVDNNYTNRENLYCMGGSAGGLLIGAVINMAPDLWKGAIAAVPFVDVVTTMLDESIPLTTGEYDEWGNPNDKEYYDYIKTYSPYDNVAAQDYPALLVTTGYHDSQVQYWEPAKWVARLRHLKTDNNPLLLHTEMGAGHGGKSGRFERYRETALEYAFLLDLAGKADVAMDEK